MPLWRNEVEGGSGRTDDNRGPKPARAWQPTGPGEGQFNGLTPQPSARQGEDSRMYRRARVTAS
jgi:hypothetical protein